MKRTDRYYKNRTAFSWKLICLLILYNSYSFSQNINTLYDIIYSKNLSNEDKIIKADSLINLLEVEKKDVVKKFYFSYAYWFLNRQDDLPKAILYVKKAYDYEKAEGIKDTMAFLNYATNLAYYYNLAGEYKNAISVYDEAIRADINNRSAANMYMELGNIHLNLLDFYKAKKYYKSAIDLLKNKPDRLDDLRNGYHNLATTCISIYMKESLQEAKIYAFKADSLAAQVNSTSDENKFRIKLNVARIHKEKATLDFDISFDYYKQALAIAEQLKDTVKIIRIYEGIGDLYNIIDQDESINALKTALSFTKEKDSVIRGELYSSLGLTQLLKKDYDAGIESKHRGIAYLTGNDFKDLKEINFNFLINLPNREYLFDFLPQLAEGYLKYFELSGKREYLNKSIAYFKLADQVIDLTKLNASEFKSRLFWRRISTDIYSKAIRACFLSGDTEQAFYFMEKNKALLLLEDIAEQAFKNTLELPKSFLKKEKSLKKKILLLEWEIEKNPEEVKLLKKELLDTQRALSNMLDSVDIGKNKITISPSIISLEEVQKTLTEDEILIEYHVSAPDESIIYTNQENGYALFITKESVRFFEIPGLSVFKEEVSRLIELSKRPFESEEDIVGYRRLSHNVFGKLFPETTKEFIQEKKLIIISDSYLSLINFEVLSSKNDELHYLIRDHEIRYLYSYSFLKNTQKEKRQKTSFLGVAPGTFKDKNLVSLTNSDKELESLKKYYKGTTLTGSIASKNAFLNEFENHGIVHLATHADAQDATSPWIVFNDEKLLLEELYLTENNASLVVLSGCNTTLGEQAIGEGVISLARGFFYSGSQTVMSTLWSIDDRATSTLIADFYKNLSKGQTKSSALHNAKLNYLNTHSLSEQSPYYWASFILLGENDTLSASSQSWIWYGLLLTLILIFSIIFFRKKGKKSAL